MYIKRISGEYWYPAVSSYGVRMPFGDGFTGEVRLKNNPTPNQMEPLIISSKGRSLYKKDGFTAVFKEDVIETEEGVIEARSGDTLREAFLYCAENYFNKARIDIAEEFMCGISYNTWMHAPVDITEDKTVKYAKELLELGFEPGVLMIDDKWSDDYGSLVFDENKFPNPKRLFDTLHELGFKVMLWFCPFVSFDSRNYELYREKGWLLMEGDDIFPLKWWNGTSACIDLRIPEAYEHLRNEMEKLVELGADGFKMDGGDAQFYKEEHEPDRQSHLWARLASLFPYNEVRADFCTGGYSIFERLCDKKHTWGEGGIDDILPDALALGLGGHPFFAPDMVGGGEVNDIINGVSLRKDIFIAHAQIGLFMPNLQFSILPDRVLGEDMSILRSLLKQRKEYTAYMKQLAEESAVTKLPMLRLLEFEFPNQGFEEEKEMFMLGSKYLAVPISKENETAKKVRLPEGEWLFEGNKVSGEMTVSLRNDRVAVFERL